MFITKLNGEIIYYSFLHIGAHNQSYWNELNLCQFFLEKLYGIMGNSGFTFNRQSDEVKIINYKLHKKPKKNNLTLIQKN
jgi:hypothetical protein